MLRVIAPGLDLLCRFSLPEPLEDTSAEAATARRCPAGSFHVYRLFLGRSGLLQAAPDKASVTSRKARRSGMRGSWSPILQTVGFSVLICLVELVPLQAASAATMASSVAVVAVVAVADLADLADLAARESVAAASP